MMSETFVWLIYHFWHLSLSSTLCLDSETDVLQQLDHVAHLEKNLSAATLRDEEVSCTEFKRQPKHSCFNCGCGTFTSFYLSAPYKYSCLLTYLLSV